ncbi:MAG: hypothetical protein HOH19_07935 [Kordiimonadaceae bacterium]|jgi:predicted ATPase with chaperone activity|nr:hypothetical protein [Kordiimonadaceae bacterium]MBT6032490.1 hypothetical protein [Kordiimonadaceae bacterium]
MYFEPKAPKNLSEVGYDPSLVLQLIGKGMYLENLETALQFSKEIKLPTNVIDEALQILTNRKQIESLGMVANTTGGIGSLRYKLTTTGKNFVQDALNQNQYFGPAPVPLEKYCDQVIAQSIGGERVSPENIEEAFSDIVVPADFTRRLGPAVNSGMSILIYGPAGNGKTTVAEKVAHIFESAIYIPHAIEVNGSIIKVFDSSVHINLEIEKPPVERRSLIRALVDKRFVPCKRPVIITGGELNMEMLDLKFNEVSKYYEAPLHIKALNGTFIIDDFGRQQVSPEQILNRWIVPLQSRIDFLKLHSGKTFELPFDELVIFSTNLSPNDLMDPAFLRRIPYKLETKDPSIEAFKAIYNAVARKAGLELTDEIFDYTVNEITQEAGKSLAAYQPKFIIDQVKAACKYQGIELTFTKEVVAEGLANLYVQDSDFKGQVGMSAPT